MSLTVDTLVQDILNQTESTQKRTLFSHFCSLVKRLNKSSSDLTYSDIEEISAFIKENTFDYINPQTDIEINKTKIFENELTEYTNLLRKFVTEKQKLSKKGEVQDLCEESKYWADAGIGFGEEQNYIIQKAMNKLADNPNIKRVRFWGKIFGSTRDYYILYGEKVLQWKDDPNPEIEPDTEGVNEVSFWVSNNPLSEFKELPPIAPHHIKIAKNIKVLFSGDLDRNIYSLPPFQGQERHYLKAQLVRITHGSCIVPAKIYKLKDDDDQKIEFDKDGFEFPAPAELMGLENWLHRYPNILNAGRIKHWFPANVEDEVKDKIEGEDPVKERLKTIVEDEAPQGIEAGKVVEGFEAGNWLVRTYGDTQPFTSESEKVNVYSATLIRTLLWPGSMTLAMPMRSAWSFLYVGTGMKSVQMFIPKQPENIKDDPEDLEEFPEPNPNQAPSEKMESDSDAPADEEDD